MDKLEPFHIASGNVKYSDCWKTQSGSSSQSETQSDCAAQPLYSQV